MTYQQRSVSGYKSKERPAAGGGGGGGGGKSKPNNFLKLSLPGGCWVGVGALISPCDLPRPGIVAEVPAVQEVTPGPGPGPRPSPGGGVGPPDV